MMHNQMNENFGNEESLPPSIDVQFDQMLDRLRKHRQLQPGDAKAAYQTILESAKAGSGEASMHDERLSDA